MLQMDIGWCLWLACISSATALGDSEDENMTDKNVEIGKEDKEDVCLDVADNGIRTKEEFEEIYGGLHEWYDAQSRTLSIILHE